MYHLLSIINKDVFFHIQSFIFNFSANTIRFYWLKFFSYKSFIIDCIFNLPLIHSSFDNDFIYDITHPFTLFFFKKLSKLINGREKSFKLIYYFYYTLALSIDDYEWSNGFFNYSYHFNRIICLSISQFFNWNHIIHILK